MDEAACVFADVMDGRMEDKGSLRERELGRSVVEDRTVAIELDQGLGRDL